MIAKLLAWLFAIVMWLASTVVLPLMPMHEAGRSVHGPDISTPAQPTQPTQPTPTNPTRPGHGQNQTNATAATAAQSQGLVLITTDVAWDSGTAMGTGMIIDPSGIVVTNHHVVAGSTSVSVTVPSINQTFTADVLGYDATADVAVLQLEGASRLATITTNSSAVSPGQSITAVGNSDGAGQLLATPGQVLTTSTDITVTEDDGTTADLTNLIELSCNLIPGDSGGAVFNDKLQVVGMNVAGSSGRSGSGYAIPITTVLKVAETVRSGRTTDTVSIGRTGGLGVTISTRGGRITVTDLVPGGPAEQAGITRNSILVSLDGTPVSTQPELKAVLNAHRPGDTIPVTWTDEAGQSHTADVTLTAAPLL